MLREKTPRDRQFDTLQQVGYRPRQSQPEGHWRGDSAGEKATLQAKHRRPFDRAANLPALEAVKDRAKK